VKDIDEYIAGFPPDIQQVLSGVRALIHEEAPDAVEKIAYNMPTFYLYGNLLHFAAFKDHYGFFPAPAGIVPSEAELTPFRTGSDTLRFPLDKPLPWELIREIVRFRMGENKARAEAKRKRKKPSP